MTARVFIVDGARTPFLRAGDEPGPFSATELALVAGRALLSRQPFAASDLDEVILGCVMPAADEANIARIVGLRLGAGAAVPAFTVQRNCASGLQAVASAFDHIQAGRAHLALAGGTESMSRAPLQWNEPMGHWFRDLKSAKNLAARIRVVTRFRPSHMEPVSALALGLRDPTTELTMGQTAEIVAARFGVDRRAQDLYALQSHQRAADAIADARLRDEVEIAYERSGRYHDNDDGVRADCDLEQLSRLAPAFERPFGTVTAGNSSQITDGAALVLLASEEAVARNNLPILAEIVDHDWAGVPPAEMGLGPVHAAARLLGRHGLTTKDLAQVELNEAFAGQVLACQEALSSADYARDELGLSAPLGAVDSVRLNPEGGAIAIGHPVGASGARLVLHLARALTDKRGGFGLAALCIGGGQGGAMLLRSKGSE